MNPWNPGEYLRFGDERTQPSIDLVARIDVDDPATIVDLGCGPGNSTAVLRRRWPRARTTGVDVSPEMIATAQESDPTVTWTMSRIETWRPAGRVGVVFANASLQWVRDHGTLVPRLFGYAAPGGALAFQVPSAQFAIVRTLIHDIAREGPWASKMADPLTEMTLESPGFYYDCLASAARAVDIWETEYCHVMPAPSAIVDWMAATGLRPFLRVLDPSETTAFLDELHRRVAQAYPRQRDGRVLFPFRRTFVIAYAT
jgi:trans-aconitate 2-methyltransferase